jgi:hypothetical protein
VGRLCERAERNADRGACYEYFGFLRPMELIGDCGKLGTAAAHASCVRGVFDLNVVVNGRVTIAKAAKECRTMSDELAPGCAAEIGVLMHRVVEHRETDTAKPLCARFFEGELRTACESTTDDKIDPIAHLPVSAEQIGL